MTWVLWHLGHCRTGAAWDVCCVRIETGSVNAAGTADSVKELPQAGQNRPVDRQPHCWQRVPSGRGGSIPPQWIQIPFSG